MKVPLQWLAAHLAVPDVVLIKASHSGHLERIAEALIPGTESTVP